MEINHGNDLEEQSDIESIEGAFNEAQNIDKRSTDLRTYTKHMWVIMQEMPKTLQSNSLEVKSVITMFIDFVSSKIFHDKKEEKDDSDDEDNQDEQQDKGLYFI